MQATTPQPPQDLSIPGPAGPLALRVYRPGTARAGLPIVLYFHGGGFIGGSLDDAHAAAAFIAEHTPALVIAVDYALAPAKPFPAAPEDAYAAARWAVEHAAELGGAPERLAVAGDDAGGNLAAALSLIARDRNGPAILAQVLVGPMLDPSMTRLGDGARLNSDLSAATCADCYRQYLPQPRQRLHPYASPLVSVRQAGLPPALIITAECDVLHKEAETYAEALIAAGVATQVVRLAGLKHAALASHRPALAEIAHFLRRRLGEQEIPADPPDALDQRNEHQSPPRSSSETR
ncbi:alpha/beta hydrolase [Uliginosibacterium sp. TH139]|uniref:alpha/beta hydrolase n=1 Tax=Uliginosibacterium sp. TH139 TaxID=2067453 RepID=UPI000C7CA630|nr:alpha/beta hydrolase [Uliginosibacterium sp. TH139]PLK47017.1 esterase [Uliginosibacterium sp. TH139]